MSEADHGKVGVYDSRVVAYAHFWQEAQQRQLKALYEAAKEAETSGDTNRASQLKASLRAGQERIHLQVFSTAPIDNVLEDMKDRVEVVKTKADVACLVSKWDEDSLKAHATAQQVNVTDLLLEGFTLSEKQQRIAKSFKSQPPLPLEQAKQMLKEDKL
jgi:CDP-glycerol glycerophosphotransferase (TagB/SpsB family)